jgi:hypothetical protein
MTECLTLCLLSVASFGGGHTWKLNSAALCGGNGHCVVDAGFGCWIWMLDLDAGFGCWIWMLEMRSVGNDAVEHCACLVLST